MVEPKNKRFGEKDILLNYCIVLDGDKEYLGIITDDDVSEAWKKGDEEYSKVDAEEFTCITSKNTREVYVKKHNIKRLYDIREYKILLNKADKFFASALKVASSQTGYDMMKAYRISLIQGPAGISFSIEYGCQWSVPYGSFDDFSFSYRYAGKKKSATLIEILNFINDLKTDYTMQKKADEFKALLIFQLLKDDMIEIRVE